MKKKPLNQRHNTRYRSMICINPACQEWFLCSRHDAKFCSSRCREVVRHQRRKASAEATGKTPA